MSRKAILSPKAKHNLEALLNYLKEEWSEKVKQAFISKFDKALQQVIAYPQSCPESKEIKGAHKKVVSKQTSFYYRITKQEIQIVILFDTRQDPDKLKP